MAYKIHFVGLACFVKQREDYVVLLPDARDGKIGGHHSNDEPNGNDKADHTHPHRPYLIIPTTHVEGPCVGTEINKCCVVELSAGTTLIFPGEDTAQGVDDSDILSTANAYHWHEIDCDFEPNLRAEEIAVRVPITHGTIVARRMHYDKDPSQAAIIHEVTIELSGTGSFSIDAGGRTFQVKPGAEIVVANVAPQWIDDERYVDDDEHFLLYYKLDRGNGKFKKPKAKTQPPQVTASQHPYLSPYVVAAPAAELRGTEASAEGVKAAKSLRVACSNTTYP